MCITHDGIEKYIILRTIWSCFIHICICIFRIDNEMSYELPNPTDDTASLVGNSLKMKNIVTVLKFRTTVDVPDQKKFGSIL